MRQTYGEISGGAGLRGGPSVMRAGGIALLGALMACSSSEVHDDRGADVGRLRMRLSTELDGATYRLFGAVFSIDGPQARLVETGDEEVLSLPLPVGDYQVELLDGWQLQRSSDEDFVGIEAELASDPVQAFVIRSDEITNVNYQFRVDGQVIGLDNGELQLGISVVTDQPPTPFIIEGDVRITNQAELDALVGVTEITGFLSIDGPVTTLAPLSTLAHLGRGLSIESSLLEDLSGLEQLSSWGVGEFPETQLWLQGNSLLTNVDALSGVTTGEGCSIDVRDNPVLTNLDGLINLRGYANLSAIWDNESLVTLRGLSGLNGHSSLLIEDNPQLTDLGLDEHTFIGGGLYIVNNDALTDLRSLENLASAQSLVIQDNATLSSIEQLSSLVELFDLQVTNNPSLPQCQVDALVEQLDSTLDLLISEGNAACQP